MSGGAAKLGLGTAQFGLDYGVSNPRGRLSLQEAKATLKVAADAGVSILDTAAQYAFTRAVADHMFSNYDGVLKVDGEVGNKKAYDPRAWGKLAEEGMAQRVVRACEDLRSTGTAIKG